MLPETTTADATPKKRGMGLPERRAAIMYASYKSSNPASTASTILHTSPAVRSHCGLCAAPCAAALFCSKPPVIPPPPRLRR